MLRQDGRWQYGLPPAGNANFAWGHHFLFHLAPTGAAGLVLFIDASELGYMVNRRNRAFDEGDIQKITGTYREWKLTGGAIIAGGVCPIEIVEDYSEFAIRCLAF